MTVKSSVFWKVHVTIGRNRPAFSLTYTFSLSTLAFTSVFYLLPFRGLHLGLRFKSLRFGYAFSSFGVNGRPKMERKVSVFGWKRFSVNAAWYTLGHSNTSTRYTCIRPGVHANHSRQCRPAGIEIHHYCCPTSVKLTTHTHTHNTHTHISVLYSEYGSVKNLAPSCNIASFLHYWSCKSRIMHVSCTRYMYLAKSKSCKFLAQMFVPEILCKILQHLCYLGNSFKFIKKYGSTSVLKWPPVH